MFRSVDQSTLRRDRDLVRRLCVGDDEAVTTFCRTYLPKVYRFALAHVATQADAADVMENVMRDAARRIETYRGDTTLLVWLMRICRDEVIQRHVSEPKRPPEMDGPSSPEMHGNA